MIQSNHYYIKAKCCAEQKKTQEYELKVVITQKGTTFYINQGSCSCPAGAGWSAACKHIGALCFSLEFFSVTGNVCTYII